MRNRAERKSANIRWHISLTFFIISFYCVDNKTRGYNYRYPSQRSHHKIVHVLFDQERHPSNNGPYPPEDNQNLKIDTKDYHPLMLSSKPWICRKTFSQLLHILYSKKSKSLYFLIEKVLSWLQKIRLNTINSGFVIRMFLILTYIITILLSTEIILLIFENY